jgi:hypothetical protein
VAINAVIKNINEEGSNDVKFYKTLPSALSKN